MSTTTTTTTDTAPASETTPIRGQAQNPGPIGAAPTHTPPEAAPDAVGYVDWMHARHAIADGIASKVERLGQHDDLARTMLYCAVSGVRSSRCAEDALALQQALSIALIELGRLGGYRLSPEGRILAVRLTPPTEIPSAPWMQVDPQLGLL